LPFLLLANITNTGAGNTGNHWQQWKECSYLTSSQAFHPRGIPGVPVSEIQIQLA
jgi:hypothetical protein